MPIARGGGLQAMDEVLIFKALVLQTLYNLPNNQMEYRLRDRPSFICFVGLGLADAVPDAKTPLGLTRCRTGA